MVVNVTRGVMTGREVYEGAQTARPFGLKSLGTTGLIRPACFFGEDGRFYAFNLHAGESLPDPALR